MPKVFRVFVSHSHEDSSHDEWVLNLAADLRRNGVDTSLDEWDLIPGQDMTLFMESQIRDSDFVILIGCGSFATTLKSCDNSQLVILRSQVQAGCCRNNIGAKRYV